MRDLPGFDRYMAEPPDRGRSNFEVWDDLHPNDAAEYAHRWLTYVDGWLDYEIYHQAHPEVDTVGYCRHMSSFAEWIDRQEEIC